MSNYLSRTILSSLVILLCVLQESQSFTDSNSKAGVNHPAQIMDYKIHVDAGKQECVFLYTEPNAVLYVDFRMIRGGEGSASFTVRDPQGTFVLTEMLKTMATYETKDTMHGYYTICADNQYSQFSSTVIGFYMATYKTEEWDKYIEEFTQIDVHADIFGQAFRNISEGVTQMLQYLYQSRSQEARDFALASDNNYSISFWSFVQCIVIVGTSLINVFTIRRLFRENPSTGKFSAKL